MTIYVYKLKYAILVDRRINRTTTTTTKQKQSIARVLKQKIMEKYRFIDDEKMINILLFGVQIFVLF
jgi:hypothetical protein